MIAILDIDGTLVDTNYQHAIAWYRAFRRLDLTLPVVDLHRHIGMGGDQLVPDVAGEDFERDHGDEARDHEREEYQRLIGEVELLEGARELIDALRERGATVVLASSAKQDEAEHYLELLGVDDLPYTTSADVETTKPAPDLVEAALAKAGADEDGEQEAFMLGDSVYDCEAAGRAGIPTIGLLTGGFSEEELRGAGATFVHRRLPDVLADLDSVFAASTRVGAEGVSGP